MIIWSTYCVLRSFILKLAKKANFTSYIHSPGAPTISATSIQALFFFVISIHVLQEIGISRKHGYKFIADRN